VEANRAHLIPMPCYGNGVSWAATCNLLWPDPLAADANVVVFAVGLLAVIDIFAHAYFDGCRAGVKTSEDT